MNDTQRLVRRLKHELEEHPEDSITKILDKLDSMENASAHNMPDMTLLFGLSSLLTRKGDTIDGQSRRSNQRISGTARRIDSISHRPPQARIETDGGSDGSD